MHFDEIQGIFFQECEEGLATIETNLALARAADPDAETINTIFRAVHSIKGGAGAFGFGGLQGFSHHLETVLDMLRTGEQAPTPELIALLFAAFDVLSDHVASAQSDGIAPNDATVLQRLAAVADCTKATEVETTETPIVRTTNDAAGDDELMDFDLDALIASIDQPTPVDVPWQVVLHPGRGAFDNGADPLLLLRELESLGGEVVALDHSALPWLPSMAADECYLGWTVIVPATVARDEIETLFDFVPETYRYKIAQGETATSPEQSPSAIPASTEETIASTAKPAPDVPAVAEPSVELQVAPIDGDPGKAPPASATIRVELDKLDRLVNLVGELVITQAMLAQRLSQLGSGAIDELSDLDHLTRELQDSAMSIRAQPVKSVFNRVPRIIRELESGTGKRVRLEVEGEMTEVDKTVVERIGEPLTHMIRNAVDHGLEMPDERVAIGKPAQGLVRLAAEHRSGRIVISVADDGKGIDLVRVRAKAVERGIIAADAHLSDEEIENLIFAPGFSTAATISNISGRGVGMDVVRRNVQALGGRIGITSKFGKGSTFTLTLPLTLAILDGMVVSVGSQTYVIPLAHVVESLRPNAGEVRAFGPNAGVLDVRGAYLPILPVGRLLSVDDACGEPTEAVLVVVETDVGRAILMVDGIQDQRQVVVKSLETNFAPVPGLSGATVLGDGRVALIVDVETLVRRHRCEPSRALAA